MLHLIAALLIPVMGSVKALLASPRGRHAARRRRSTRVRRYAPLPAPEQTAQAAPTSASVADPPWRTARPAPRLAPPARRIPADDVALVRPYYLSHERARAGTRTRTHPSGLPRPRIPSGDLLAPPVTPAPGEFDELAALVRTWREHRGEVPVA
ncbi:hypothetical protein ACIBFB_24610 [Nocardiopsis sp. NPDC050513]|uniref:hypothetical protein n=1 Tax=Nocardiopsis sp. NPDC050513 TaxID=3364338 RepID=UPI0037A67173